MWGGDASEGCDTTVNVQQRRLDSKLFFSSLRLDVLVMCVGT